MELGADLARVPAHDTARGALRHGAGPYDTASWAATIRRWARGRLSERACWASSAGAGALGAGASGRAGVSGRAGGRRGVRRGERHCMRYGRPWLRHGRAKGHDTTTVRTPGRAWVPSLASWVPMHLTQFFDLVFDSVLF